MSDCDPVALLLLKMALVPLRPWPALLGFEKPQSGSICQASNDKGPLEHMTGFLEPPSRFKNGARKLAWCSLCQAGTRVPSGGSSLGVRQMGHYDNAANSNLAPSISSAHPIPRCWGGSRTLVTPRLLMSVAKRHYETQHKVIFPRKRGEGMWNH